MLIKTALSRALGGVVLEPRDVAAVELARKYAALLDDDPEQAWRVGPRLLEVLIELGMTPKARAAIRGGIRDGGSTESSALDELRAARARRAASQHAAIAAAD